MLMLMIVIKNNRINIDNRERLYGRKINRMGNVKFKTGREEVLLYLGLCRLSLKGNRGNHQISRKEGKIHGLGEYKVGINKSMSS